MMSENRTEAEREFGSYEEIGMPDHLVPVKIVPRRMDLHSVGCSFHWHEALEFYCVEQGGVLLLCGGRREWIRAGETGFVNWCRPHRGMAFLADTRYHIVQIGPELFSGETLLLPGQKEPCGYLSLLLSFGVRELSVLPAALLPTRKAVSRWSLEEAHAVAARALELETENQVRAWLEENKRL